VAFFTGADVSRFFFVDGDVAALVLAIFLIDDDVALYFTDVIASDDVALRLTVDAVPRNFSERKSSAVLALIVDHFAAQFLTTEGISIQNQAS